EQPRPIAQQRRTVPPHVAAVTARALEKLPADRFESAAEMIRALDDPGFRYEARGEAAVGSGRKRADERTDSGSRRTAILAAALAVAVVLAGWGWLRSPDSPPAPMLRTTLDLGDVELEDHSLFEVVISPDGSRFAVVGQTEDGQMMYHRTADELEFQPIPGTEGSPIHSPSFSPDGDWLVYADPNRGLMKVSLLGGRPTVLVPARDDELEPRLTHWGPDGWIVFWAGISDGRSALYRVPDTGGELEELVGEPWRAIAPQLLPGSEAVVFTDESTRSVAIYELAADTVRVLVEQALDGRYVPTGHLLYLDLDGGLWAAPFDPDAGEIVGAAKPVMQGIMSNVLPPVGRYSVSDNGTFVYGTGGTTADDASHQLAFVPLDGPIAPLDLSPRWLEDFTWHPNGRQVAFAQRPQDQLTGDREIALYDLQLENAPTVLTRAGDNQEPMFSPDGRRLVFSSRRDGTAAHDLFILDLEDDTGPRHLVLRPAWQAATDWPEEDVIVIESFSAGQTGLYLVDISGDSAAVRPYYVPDADVDRGVVSPDGTLMAYHSDETGRDEVYVRSYPEPGPETMISADGGGHPMWAPDGRTLYYGKEAGDSIEIYAAEIGYDPGPTVLARTLLRAWSSDWSAPELDPSGERFLTRFVVGRDTAGTRDPEPQRYFVVTNWFRQLERLFADGGRRQR
ncbi:MAG: hypothetical protein R3314_13260, partial [Longimicrobiales bacterium]|nr:hypothetical protein [Longimicrobiales bacterium]